MNKQKREIKHKYIKKLYNKFKTLSWFKQELSKETRLKIGEKLWADRKKAIQDKVKKQQDKAHQRALNKKVKKL